MRYDDEVIADVARCFYDDGLTQEAIAKQINASRSTVSRLLQMARDRGIVRIQIDYPWGRAADLEQRLIERFHLREAHFRARHRCVL